MMRDRPSGQKPYEFLPFPEKVLSWPDVPQAALTDADHITAFLEFAAMCKAPVHVGSGYFEPIGPRTALKLRHRHLLTTRAGQQYLTVPGSTLKGVVRSIYEAITHSCARVLSPQTRRLRSARQCAAGEVCPACSLFGHTGVAGRVAFWDSYIGQRNAADVDTPRLSTPRRRGALPTSYTRTPGRKFYRHLKPAKGGTERREAIREGTQFTVKVNLSPVTMAEAGAVLAALGCAPGYKFGLKLGAGKPIGLGFLVLKPSTARVLDRASSLRASGRLGSSLRELKGTDLQDWIMAAFKEATESQNGKKPLVDKEALRFFKDLWADIQPKEEAVSPY